MSEAFRCISIILESGSGRIGLHHELIDRLCLYSDKKVDAFASSNLKKIVAFNEFIIYCMRIIPKLGKKLRKVYATGTRLMIAPSEANFFSIDSYPRSR